MSPSHRKVTIDAEVAIAVFHAIMRTKGYKMKSITQSAATEFRYGKSVDPIRDYDVSITMHHGRGKWGPGKAILALHHNHKQMFSMTHECTQDASSPIDYRTSQYTEVGAIVHARLVEDIREFLMTL